MRTLYTFFVEDFTWKPIWSVLFYSSVSVQLPSEFSTVVATEYLLLALNGISNYCRFLYGTT